MMMEQEPTVALRSIGGFRSGLGACSEVDSSVYVNSTYTAEAPSLNVHLPFPRMLGQLQPLEEELDWAPST